MKTGLQTLDESFLEMRWRVLSLAADLDRIGLATRGQDVLASDPRIVMLREALRIVENDASGRAERVQQLFSDHTPPPPRT